MVITYKYVRASTVLLYFNVKKSIKYSDYADSVVKSQVHLQL